MKKLVLFFAVVVAVSFASCGGAKTESTEAQQPQATETPAPVTPDSTQAAAAPADSSAAVQK
ncbi:MAG: hypothetical protein FWF54_06650 [Candidatus Azobacteroides sp.]|nr:hypothetical protein [Candidatus Azobacteroides sp.]